MSRSLADIFKKVQNLKSTFEEKRAELAKRHVELKSDGINVVASCDKQIVSIDIDPETLAEPVDKEKIQNALLSALNKALGEADKVQKEEAKKALGDIGLNLPGLF